MPFNAILIDCLALFMYYIQLQNTNLHLLGLVVQGVIVLLLLILSFTYQGKRHAKTPPIGYRYFSIRYAILIFSVLINALVLFLYVLNYLGINDLIFTLN